MIGLTKDTRRRHMYIIGATGTGKSTMILAMINQDIQNNKGLAVVDPHGELAESAIACIPESRKDDLIYFNPDDLKYPIGINLMELTSGLDEEDSLREKEFIAESVISLFRKVFSTAMSGSPHRIEYILRNTIHTAFTVENPTLFTIFELLNNPVFQQKVVAKLQDENLKNFWKFEFGKAGDFQRVKMVSPVTARIGRFLFSPSAKRILEQPKSTINFDEILDGKILICNLAKGKLGEDSSQVLGIMILNKLQLAALKRARVTASKRKDFYLYVDEFQNFATKSFVDMLSESRKYKLNLVIAEQSTSQQT
ncbi:MAG: type IV secretory system conjugative DNA transfer family protein, partial [Nitrosotalea sp.]